MLGRIFGAIALACALVATHAHSQSAAYRTAILNATRPPSLGGAGGGGGGSPPAYAWATLGLIPTTSTSATTNSTGQTITSGMLLVAWMHINDSANNDRSPTGNNSMACPAGFTAASGFSHFDGGTNSGINIDVCWKIAGGSETGAYQFTWTGGNTVQGSWSLVAFTGANASTPVEASAVQNNGSSSNSTSSVTPSVSSGGANRLWVSCVSAQRSTQTFTVPASPGTFSSAFASTVSASRLACATQTVGAGATGSATWTLGTADASQGVSMILQP